MSVTLHLDDDLDVSRGDMICHPGDAPAELRHVEADICWMSDRPLAPRGRYLLKHTTRTVTAIVEEVRSRMDVRTLEASADGGSLELNDIGRVLLRTSAPLAADTYRHNRTTGSLILIDENTNDTAGAGMIAA